MKTRFDNPLDKVRVASPCSADWDQMVGNERARFCGQCNLHVYNLSSMTRNEAEQLIGRTEGRLCVRYFRRADGTILTSDCPVGLRAVRRRMSYVARAVASAVLSFFAGVGLSELRAERSTITVGMLAFEPPEGRMVQPPEPVQVREEMGTFMVDTQRPRIRVRRRAPRH